MVLSDASDQNIRKTVIVIIADGDTHSIKLNVQARRASNVRKSAVAVVLVKLERGAAALVAWPVHGVYQQNVGISVGIIV